MVGFRLTGTKEGGANLTIVTDDGQVIVAILNTEQLDQLCVGATEVYNQNMHEFILERLKPGSAQERERQS